MKFNSRWSICARRGSVAVIGRSSLDEADRHYFKFIAYDLPYKPHCNIAAGCCEDPFCYRKTFCNTMDIVRYKSTCLFASVIANIGNGFLCGFYTEFLIAFCKIGLSHVDIIAAEVSIFGINSFARWFHWNWLWRMKISLTIALTPLIVHLLTLSEDLVMNKKKSIAKVWCRFCDFATPQNGWNSLF